MPFLFNFYYSPNLSVSSQVFQKGSPLAIDISEAILKVTQSGHVDTLEKNMLHLLNCSTSSYNHKTEDIRLGPGPFSGLFQVLGVVLGVVFLIAFVRLLKKMDYMWQSLVLNEWYTRFGSNFFRQKIVGMNVVDAEMEPNIVEIQMLDRR